VGEAIGLDIANRKTLYFQTQSPRDVMTCWPDDNTKATCLRKEEGINYDRRPLHNWLQTEIIVQYALRGTREIYRNTIVAVLVRDTVCGLITQRERGE
jgi:hypothetical protein